MSDSKTKPAHYQPGKGDVIDLCQRYNLSFTLGNVVKYVARAGKKQGESELSDLLKAREYLDREIAFVQERFKCSNCGAVSDGCKCNEPLY